VRHEVHLRQGGRETQWLSSEHGPAKPLFDRLLHLPLTARAPDECQGLTQDGSSFIGTLE
jgi:hypothetical protein